MNMIKKYRTLLMMMILTSMLFGLTACMTAGEGALVGGGLGAASGAVLSRHDPLAGALIGGAVGAASGAVIGDANNREARRYERDRYERRYDDRYYSDSPRYYYRTAPPPPRHYYRQAPPPPYYYY